MIRDDLKHDMDDMTKFYRRCGALPPGRSKIATCPAVAISHITSRGWFERADRPS